MNNEHEYGLAWHERKQKYYKDYGRKCEICGTTNHVELHHLDYDHDIGMEPDSSLMALCPQHHYDTHDDQHMEVLNSVKNLLNGVKNQEKMLENYRMCPKCEELNSPERWRCKSCNSPIV